MTKIKRRYWAMHDFGLRNGSFIRSRLDGTKLVQWMNGDCMGLIETMPKGFKEVSQDHAEKLIPAVCW
jgi:hypothetical protein